MKTNEEIREFLDKHEYDSHTDWYNIIYQLLAENTELRKVKEAVIAQATHPARVFIDGTVIDEVFEMILAGRKPGGRNE